MVADRSLFARCYADDGSGITTGKISSGALLKRAYALAPGRQAPSRKIREMAMKAASIVVAGLAVATLLIAAATADPAVNSSFPDANGPWVGCSVSAGFKLSGTCRNYNHYKTYIECKEGSLKKLGWRDFETWWYCSSLGLK